MARKSRNSETSTQKPPNEPALVDTAALSTPKMRTPEELQQIIEARRAVGMRMEDPIDDGSAPVPEIPTFKINGHTHRDVRKELLEANTVWRPIGRTSFTDLIRSRKGVANLILLHVEVRGLDDGSFVQGWAHIRADEVALIFSLRTLRTDRHYSFADKFGGHSSTLPFDQTIVVREITDFVAADEIVLARMKPSKPSSSSSVGDASLETVELENLIHYTSLDDRKHEIFAGVHEGKWQTRYCSRSPKGPSLLLGNARLEILDVIHPPKGNDLQASYRIAIFTAVEDDPDIVVVTRHKLFSDQDTDFQKKLRGHGFEVGKDGLNVLRLLIDVQESHQFRNRVSLEYSDPIFQFAPLRNVEYVATTGYIPSNDGAWFDAYVTPVSTILANGSIITPENSDKRLAPVPVKHFEKTSSLCIYPTADLVSPKVSSETVAALDAVMRLYGRDTHGNVKTVLGGLWGAAMATRIPFMFEGRRSPHSFVAVLGVTGKTRNGKTRCIATVMLPFNSRGVCEHDYEDMSLVNLTPQPRRDFPTYYGNSPCLTGDLGAENDKSAMGKRRREILETHVSNVHDGSTSSRGLKNGDNEFISSPAGLQIVQAQYSLKEAYSTGNEGGDKIASRLIEFRFDWKIDKEGEDAKFLNLMPTRSSLNDLEPAIIVWTMNKPSQFFADLFNLSGRLTIVKDREGTLLRPVIYGLLCWKAFLSEMGVEQFHDEFDAYIVALNEQTASQQFYMEQTALEEREWDRADDIIAALKQPFVEGKAHIHFDTPKGKPSPEWLKKHDITDQEVGWKKDVPQGVRVAKGYEKENRLSFYQPSLSLNGPLSGVYAAFAKHDQILKRKELTECLLSQSLNSEREYRRDPLTGKGSQFIDTSLDWLFPVRVHDTEITPPDPSKVDAVSVPLTEAPSVADAAVDVGANLLAAINPERRHVRRTTSAPKVASKRTRKSKMTKPVAAE